MRSIFFIILVFTAALAKVSIEKEVAEEAQLAAGLALAELKIRKDGKIIKEIAEKKKYNIKNFGEKISAIMVSKFMKDADERIASLIINNMQLGQINSTFDKYVDLSYDNIMDLKLEEEEQVIWNKIKDFIRRANRKIEYYDPNAPKAPARNFVENLNIDNLPDHDLTWMEYIARYRKIFGLFAAVLLFPLFYAGI